MQNITKKLTIEKVTDKPSGFCSTLCNRYIPVIDDQKVLSPVNTFRSQNVKFLLTTVTH